VPAAAAPAGAGERRGQSSRRESSGSRHAKVPYLFRGPRRSATRAIWLTSLIHLRGGKGVSFLLHCRSRKVRRRRTNQSGRPRLLTVVRNRQQRHTSSYSPGGAETAGGGYGRFRPGSPPDAWVRFAARTAAVRQKLMSLGRIEVEHQPGTYVSGTRADSGAAGAAGQRQAAAAAGGGPGRARRRAARTAHRLERVFQRGRAQPGPHPLAERIPHERRRRESRLTSMTRHLLLCMAGLGISLSAGTLTGRFVAPGLGPVANGTLLLTLSQAAQLPGSFA